MLFDLVLSTILTLPLMLSMIAMMLGSHAAIVHFFHLPIVQLVLSTPVQFYVGARFIKGHIMQSRRKHQIWMYW